jgi:hypothetical protein
MPLLKGIAPTHLGTGAFVLAVPHFPSRVLLVIDDVTGGGFLTRDLIAQGHEVTYARDTMEARWAWVRNYFECVIVCANGASGFVERIKKESPHQKIEVITPDELTGRKSPVSVAAPIAATRVQRGTNVIEMPRRVPPGEVEPK